MLGLLIETTSPQGGLALYRFNKADTKLLALKKWKEPFSHSAFITPAFEELLPVLKKELKISDLKSLSFKASRPPPFFISLGIGPGRFTGLRVGLSFAKTFSFCKNIPLYPVSSLKIMAESRAHQEKPVLVLLNAFKNSFYMALYQKKKSRLEELIPPRVVLPEKLIDYVQQDCLCLGDGYAVYKDLLPADLKKKLELKKHLFPEVKDLAKLLNREFDPSALISWKELKPVYLRSPVKLLNKNFL